MIDTIVNSFDIWSAAQGIKSRTRVKSVDNISLDGIANLRTLILELAIQGKLVGQDSNDEPAIKLLNSIAKAKEALIFDGKLKRLRTTQEINVAKAGSNLPKGWAVAKLGDVVNIINGRAYKQHEMLAKGTPLLRVGNLFTSDNWYYSDLELEPEKYIDNGDLIYAWSASFGPFIWKGGKVIYHYHIWKLDFFEPDSINKYYLFHYLTAITKAIKASGNGIAMIHMTKERMEKLVFLFPPLAEQTRIVAKVNELMSLCDKLEEQQTTNLTTHHHLVKSLLETLTNAADADELQAAWQKLAEHFDTLFCTEDSVEQLRQTLLELVVAGRFKTQNNSDTSTAETFEKIQEELAKKHGKEFLNKLTRDRSTIEPGDCHFPIPESWIWCELQDLAILFNGKAHEQFVDENGEYILVNSSFVSSEGRVAKYVSNQLTPLTEGNIAIVMSDVPGGKALVKCYLVEENDKYSLNQRIGGIDASSHIDIQYLYLVLNRNKYYLQYDDGKKQTNLRKIQILSCPVPLPPIEEQTRIVEKVKELFELCDTLKFKIERANEINQTLSKTIVDVIV